jgi:CRP-like cAMP-binding protein
VSRFAARATWPAGFTIYQRGAQADGLFMILRGRVVLRSKVRAGRGFVLGIGTEGETFGAEGLELDGRYVTDARADIDTETLQLSGARFRAFVRECPNEALLLMAQVMSERSALVEKLRELATLSVEERLCAALIRMADQNAFSSDDGSTTLDPSQYRLLCELVGATRESVSVVFGRLVSAGLAERRGTNYVVSDPSALSERLGDAWLDTSTSIPMTSEMRAHTS